MRNWFNPFLKKCERRVDYMIEEVLLTTYVAALAVVILGFGLALRFPNTVVNGIAKGDLPLTPCTYWTACISAL